MTTESPLGSLKVEARGNLTGRITLATACNLAIEQLSEGVVAVSVDGLRVIIRVSGYEKLHVAIVGADGRAKSKTGKPAAKNTFAASGGLATAAKMTQEQRKERASNAAKARWNGKQKPT